MKTGKWKAHVCAAAFVCAVLVTGTLVLPGCSKKKPEISIFIWTEYIPQSVADKFEEKYGVKVNIQTFSAIADMYAKMRSAPAGTYDVVDAGGFWVQRLAEEGYLEKLNYENIPNMKYISEGYLYKYFDPDNVYSVPYMGGVAPLVINKKYVDFPVESYRDLYRPEFKNSLVLLADFQVIIGAINVMLGFDYNERDPEKLKQTEAALFALKPNVKMLDSDSPKTAMINEDCSAGLMYSAEIAIAMEENPNLEIVFPKEGQYLFFDSLCVAKGTKNKEWAEKLINFILDPEISKSISDVYPYSNPNTEAVKLLGPDFMNNPAKNPPEYALSNGKGLEVQDHDNATLDIYNTIWTRFTTQ